MDTSNGRFSGFEEIITSFDDIRSVMGEPPPSVLAKVIDRLDEVCQAFIAQSPFVVIASASATGQLDLSPKGDPAGFVHVLDDKHLVIPDRPGNRRADTFHNVLENPQIGLLFIIPGKSETLRVSGEARIVRDHSVRAALAVQGRIPEFAWVVYVERAFMHCPKCMVRSKLWQPEAWPDHTGLATIAEAMVKHAKLDMTPEELVADVEKAGITRLY
jgi:PPOX class probable FMN-dependent enzyme